MGISLFSSLLALGYYFAPQQKLTQTQIFSFQEQRKFKCSNSPYRSNRLLIKIYQLFYYHDGYDTLRIKTINKSVDMFRTTSTITTQQTLDSQNRKSCFNLFFKFRLLLFDWIKSICIDCTHSIHFSGVPFDPHITLHSPSCPL